jgi:hypothetical protein
MNDEGNQGRERDVGKRIASLIQSISHEPDKRIAAEEMQKLRTAAGRLDQMLKAVAAADQQALRNASVRLDQLLADIRKGKDITNILKRREQGGQE